MRRILIILAFIFVPLTLIGGGYLIWDSFIRDKTITEETFDPNVKLESFNLPVIRGDSVAKYIVLDLSIVLNNLDSWHDFNKYKPRLLDAYLVEVLDYFAFIPLDQPVNAFIIRERIMKVSNAIMGVGKITSVNIDGLFERRQRGS